MENWSGYTKTAAACGAVVVFGALFLLNHSPRSQVWDIEESVLLVLVAMAVAAPVGIVTGLMALVRGTKRP